MDFDQIMLKFRASLGLVYWNNTVGDWGYAFFLFIILLLSTILARRILLSRLAALIKRTKLGWDDTILEIAGKIRLWMLLPAMLAVAAAPLTLPYTFGRALFIAAVVGASLQAFVFLGVIVDAVLTMMLKRSSQADGQPDTALASSVGVLRIVVLFLLAVVVLLVALDNLGIEIKTMLTGLGIGGIAIALAVQNILGDLFASFTILLDKPFVVGDFIIVGSQMGTVEKIGIKTTRVRALSGEQLVFSNTHLLSSTVQNFKRMQTRRVVFKFGVIYETSPEQLRRIPVIVRGAIERRQDRVRYDRCHFQKFGDYSLDFETVYYVLNSDYNKYMDVQQELNLEIFEQFAQNNIEFAYPTQLEIVRGEMSVRRPPPEANEQDAPRPPAREPDRPPQDADRV